MRTFPWTLFPRRVDHIHRIYSYQLLWHMDKTFSFLTSTCLSCCCLEDPTIIKLFKCGPERTERDHAFHVHLPTSWNAQHTRQNAKTSRKREWNSVYIVLIHTLLQFSYDDCDCVPYFAVVNSALSYLIAHLFLRYLNGRFSQFHVLGIGSQYMLTTHDHSFWSPAGLALHTALSMWPLWNIFTCHTHSFLYP